MDDQGCPRCKTTKYRNPSLKLMVNVCGHTLCESCVDLLFVRGAGNCPECGTPLRKSNFRVQLFEDPTVDKEVEIRKKVLKIYNKREEDFPSLREYNDFLEEVEEIVFNLTNNVDLDNTKKKMEIYQKENKDVIQKNKLKLTREQEELEEALEVERQENEQRRLFIQKEEQMQQILKRKNKQALLDELESSDLPVALLLAQHKDRSTQLEMQIEKPKPIKPGTFSTGIKMGQHISLAPIQKLEEALYEYQPLQIETCGPQVPEFEMLGRLGEALREKSVGDRDCIYSAAREYVQLPLPSDSPPPLATAAALDPAVVGRFKNFCHNKAHCIIECPLKLCIHDGSPTFVVVSFLLKICLFTDV
ncbi:CDK-activating kinase assembly factor MAT1 isoform X1 [Cervus canadensis]|uniref:CDK-activating kinase assembly factor MAT1 isoform X1 n=1 Tax=Cervus canadensis TaxID=1574408 RepID=UPI001C9E988F|nr:CDK-activating kinase assembly factor MAT1 isoform X1 [Cervus canadensis]